MPERRSSILSLDSEAMKTARSIIKKHGDGAKNLAALVESHDKLTQAVLSMRDNAEMILGVPDRVYGLKEGIRVANEVLQDRATQRPPVRMRELDIDDGLDAVVGKLEQAENIIP